MFNVVDMLDKSWAECRADPDPVELKAIEVNPVLQDIVGSPAWTAIMKATLDFEKHRQATAGLFNACEPLPPQLQTIWGELVCAREVFVQEMSVLTSAPQNQFDFVLKHLKTLMDAVRTLSKIGELKQRLQNVRNRRQKSEERAVRKLQQQLEEQHWQEAECTTPLPECPERCEEISLAHGRPGRPSYLEKFPELAADVKRWDNHARARADAHSHTHSGLSSGTRLKPIPGDARQQSSRESA